MKEIYNEELEFISSTIFPNKDEYFFPTVVYVTDKKVEPSFLFQGIHMTLDIWKELSNPNSIQIQNFGNISNQYDTLWNINILSEPTYLLFSSKISKKGYGLLSDRCISPQLNKLQERFKKLPENSELNKYSIVIAKEFSRLLLELEKFIKGNSELLQRLEDISNKDAKPVGESLLKQIRDIPRPVRNRTFITRPPKKVRFPQIKPPKNEITPLKKSKNIDDEIYGYSYKGWNNLYYQKRVEIIAVNARKDIKKTPNYWLKEFQAEFPQPRGYSTELGRYRDKLKRKDRHIKFKINGLIFYKGKE